MEDVQIECGWRRIHGSEWETGVDIESNVPHLTIYRRIRDDLIRVYTTADGMDGRCGTVNRVIGQFVCKNPKRSLYEFQVMHEVPDAA